MFLAMRANPPVFPLFPVPSALLIEVNEVGLRPPPGGHRLFLMERLVRTIPGRKSGKEWMACGDVVHMVVKSKLTVAKSSARIPNVYYLLVRPIAPPIQIEKKEREEWPFHFPRWLLSRSMCSLRK